MKRKIFPALLSRSERRTLANLSVKSRCSESAVIRNLLHNAELSAMCRNLVKEVLQDRSLPHRRQLLDAVRDFVEAHDGGVPDLERLLEEQEQ